MNTFKVGNKIFDKTHLMGVLKVANEDKNQILNTVEKMVNDGAEILDIYCDKNLSFIEEITILPNVIKIIKANFDIPLSICCSNAQVAKECIFEGVDMLNNCELAKDEMLIDLVFQNNLSIALMHNRNENSKSHALLLDKNYYFHQSLKLIQKYNIPNQNIILDGGVGFNKSQKEDNDLIKNYKELMMQFYEFPFMVGTAKYLSEGGKDASLIKILENTKSAYQNGVNLVRVYNLKENKMLIDSLK